MSQTGGLHVLETAWKHHSKLVAHVYVRVINFCKHEIFKVYLKYKFNHKWYQLITLAFLYLSFSVISHAVYTYRQWC